MRRLLAFIVLLFVAIAPASYFWCESSCAVPAKDVTLHGCHGDRAADGPLLAAAHKCLAQTLAPAVVVKPSSVPYVLIPSIVPFSFVADTSGAARALSVRAFDVPGSSPPGSQSPLRI